MITYDGGNAIDNFSYGYSFSLNYLSDLGRDIGYSGKNNQISFYTFNLSLIIIGISFLIYFLFKTVVLFEENKYQIQISFFVASDIMDF